MLPNPFGKRKGSQLSCNYCCQLDRTMIYFCFNAYNRLWFNDVLITEGHIIKPINTLTYRMQGKKFNSIKVSDLFV